MSPTYFKCYFEKQNTYSNQRKPSSVLLRNKATSFLGTDGDGLQLDNIGYIFLVLPSRFGKIWINLLWFVVFTYQPGHFIVPPIQTTYQRTQTFRNFLY